MKTLPKRDSTPYGSVEDTVSRTEKILPGAARWVWCFRFDEACREGGFGVARFEGQAMAVRELLDGKEKVLPVAPNLELFCHLA
jgi:hypothetical protein